LAFVKLEKKVLLLLVLCNNAINLNLISNKSYKKHEMQRRSHEIEKKRFRERFFLKITIIFVVILTRFQNQQFGLLITQSNFL